MNIHVPRISGEKNDSSNGAIPDPSSASEGGGAARLHIHSSSESEVSWAAPPNKVEGVSRIDKAPIK